MTGPGLTADLRGGTRMKMKAIDLIWRICGD